jgi:hypothetical protein
MSVNRRKSHNLPPGCDDHRLIIPALLLLNRPPLRAGLEVKGLPLTSAVPELVSPPPIADRARHPGVLLVHDVPASPVPPRRRPYAVMVIGTFALEKPWVVLTTTGSDWPGVLGATTTICWLEIAIKLFGSNGFPPINTLSTSEG